MYKNVQTNPEKFQNLTQHFCCSMLTLKKLKVIGGNGYRSVPKGGTFLTQTCPKWDKKITTACLMPLHDSMPSFMNFRRVLDLLEFQNQVSQYLRPSDGGRVFEIHSHFLHGT